MFGKCKQHIVVVIAVLSSLSAGCDSNSVSNVAESIFPGELKLADATKLSISDLFASAGSSESIRYEASWSSPELGAALRARSSTVVSAQALSPSNSAVLNLQEMIDVNFCEGFVSTADSVVIPRIPKPDYLDGFIDPAFGSRVVRITDSSLGEVNKPAYSSTQAWNADESYLLLYRTGTAAPSHILLDGHDYEFKQSLNITPADLEQVFWSHSDPDLFYYISKRSKDFGTLQQFDVSTNRSTELADFSAYCGAGLPHSGNDVQMQSVSDDMFGLQCEQDDGHHIMLSFQPSTGAVVTQPIGTGSNWSEWSAPVPAASGRNFWYQGFIIENDLATISHQLDMSSTLEHASIGMAHDGSDAYYQVGFNSSPSGCDGDLYEGVGHLIEHDMQTGGCRNLISEEQGYPYTTSGTHISAQAYFRSERVALSSVGTKDQFAYFNNKVAAPALFSEVYLAQTTPGDTQVCRVAHHRSYGKSAQNASYGAYFGEPHATISPSGTRIIFGSDWYDSGSVDSYVVELPGYIRNR